MTRIRIHPIEDVPPDREMGRHEPGLRHKASSGLEGPRRSVAAPAKKANVLDMAIFVSASPCPAASGVTPAAMRARKMGGRGGRAGGLAPADRLLHGGGPLGGGPLGGGPLGGGASGPRRARGGAPGGGSPPVASALWSSDPAAHAGAPRGRGIPEILEATTGGQ